MQLRKLTAAEEAEIAEKIDKISEVMGKQDLRTFLAETVCRHVHPKMFLSKNEDAGILELSCMFSMLAISSGYVTAEDILKEYSEGLDNYLKQVPFAIFKGIDVDKDRLAHIIEQIKAQLLAQVRLVICGDLSDHELTRNTPVIREGIAKLTEGIRLMVQDHQERATREAAKALVKGLTVTHPELSDEVKLIAELL